MAGSDRGDGGTAGSGSQVRSSGRGDGPDDGPARVAKNARGTANVKDKAKMALVVALSRARADKLRVSSSSTHDASQHVHVEGFLSRHMRSDATSTHHRVRSPAVLENDRPRATPIPPAPLVNVEGRLQPGTPLAYVKSKNFHKQRAARAILVHAARRERGEPSPSPPPTPAVDSTTCVAVDLDEDSTSSPLVNIPDDPRVDDDHHSPYCGSSESELPSFDHEADSPSAVRSDRGNGSSTAGSGRGNGPSRPASPEYGGEGVDTWDSGTFGVQNFSFDSTKFGTPDYSFPQVLQDRMIRDIDVSPAQLILMQAAPSALIDAMQMTAEHAASSGQVAVTVADGRTDEPSGRGYGPHPPTITIGKWLVHTDDHDNITRGYLPHGLVIMCRASTISHISDTGSQYCDGWVVWHGTIHFRKLLYNIATLKVATVVARSGDAATVPASFLRKRGLPGVMEFLREQNVRLVGMSLVPDDETEPISDVPDGASMQPATMLAWRPEVAYTGAHCVRPSIIFALGTVTVYKRLYHPDEPQAWPTYDTPNACPVEYLESCPNLVDMMNDGRANGLPTFVLERRSADHVMLPGSTEKTCRIEFTAASKLLVFLGNKTRRTQTGWKTKYVREANKEKKRRNAQKRKGKKGKGKGKVKMDRRRR